MDKYERHFIAQQIYDCWQIRVFIYENRELADFATDSGKRGESLMLPKTDPGKLPAKGEDCLQDGDPPVFHEVSHKIYYMAFRSGSCLYVLGPVAAGFLTDMERRDYLRIKGYPLGCQIPVIGQLNAVNILTLIHYLFTGKQLSAAELTGQVFGEAPAREQDMVSYQYDNYFQAREHFGYETESAWTAAIENGTYRKQQAPFSPDDLEQLEHIGVLAPNSSIQIEYMAITSIVLASRAAIRGGADAAAMYALSDLYFQKTAQASSEIEYLAISQSVMEDFARQVRLARQAKQETGSLVQQCRDYIDNHRTSKITVQEIADALHVNRSYLSSQFHEKTGRTIRDYLMESRMISAENLLKYSDVSISDISDYLQFCSQSHFAQAFARSHGMKPSRYRQLYRRPE